MSDGEKKQGFFGRLFSRSEAPTEAVEAPAEDNVESLPKAAETEPTSSDHSSSASENVQEAPAELSSSEPEPTSTSAEATEPEAEETAPKQSWFQRLKAGLSKTSSKLTEGITSVFTKRKLDASSIDDLEDLLIQADLGVDTAMRITDKISDGRYDKGISADEVREILADEVESVLKPVAQPLTINPENRPQVVLMVGVNGTGKTTTIGKLAAKYRNEGKKVLLAAGDTFRAAAIEQLQVWGERTGCEVMSREVGADAAGLAFDALTKAKSEGFDVLMMDTAGRLQSKADLMDELEKIVRVLKKVDPDAPHNVLLVLDATTGQNALSQVEVFGERAGVTGLVMTKLDGTARGGILVAIANKHQIPVHAIGVGEGVEDLAPFDAKEFAHAIALE
ncbi:MAG: signal recognition particle-docking protein FtsY [Hyphomicrobiaceae bacterium TMED74]|nr:signal recognition particle-docking protein FtsY [Filomicrobium sp.]RPG43826.1 MAG: signal recognition particle-docking protein FtsY [Hyphomicrobiaceae bacterium TMED74]